MDIIVKDIKPPNGELCSYWLAERISISDEFILRGFKNFNDLTNGVQSASMIIDRSKSIINK